MKKLLNIMFSPNGRISRGEFMGATLAIYLFASILPIICWAAVGVSLIDFVGWVVESYQNYGGVDWGYMFRDFAFPITVTILSYGVAFWAGAVTEIKRWHDQGKSGWMTLVTRICAFIPYVGWIVVLILVVMLIFVRGTIGDNQFGHDPAPAPSNRPLQAVYVQPVQPYMQPIQLVQPVQPVVASQPIVAPQVVPPQPVPPQTVSPEPQKDEALETLKMRFVNGEISAEEYKNIKQALEE